MTQEMKEKFTISLEDAHKILLDHGVTKSTNTQVTMRWIRDGKIDALLIEKVVWRLENGLLTRKV